MSEPTDASSGGRAPLPDGPEHFGAVGSYHVRVLPPHGNRPFLLELREYVSSDDFTGYTRRVVRIRSNAEISALIDLLGAVLRSGRLPETSPSDSSENCPSP